MAKWSSSFCVQFSTRAVLGRDDIDVISSGARRAKSRNLSFRAQPCLLSFRAKPAGRSREICHSSGAFLRFLVGQVLFKALSGKALRPLSPEMRLVL